MRPRKIFIDGPAWIGDMVMAQTLFKQLKQHYPQISIDVLAPEWTKALLDRMPEINRVWVSPFKHNELRLKDRYQWARKLRAEQYDWAIVLRNSFKSALIPYWARIPRRTGWLGEMRYGLLNDWRRLDKKKHALMIERFMALALPATAVLAKPYPQPQLLVSAASISDTLEKLSLLRPNAPVLVLCPGAEYGAAKRWPPEYFAEIAKARLKQGWQVWLLGSHKDKVITSAINALSDGRCVDLAGRTLLAEAIDLLALASLVVCNDSGLMHIAAAVGCKIVVVYGSSSSSFTPPLQEAVKMLSLNLSCSPCFKRECPLGHLQCMTKLAPQMVSEAMDELQSI